MQNAEDQKSGVRVRGLLCLTSNVPFVLSWAVSLLASGRCEQRLKVRSSSGPSALVDLKLQPHRNRPAREIRPYPAG